LIVATRVAQALLTVAAKTSKTSAWVNASAFVEDKSPRYGAPGESWESLEA